MSKIHKMAEEIRAKESSENRDKTKRIEEEANQIIKNLEKEFLNTFPDLLPILKEEGITWRGGLQDKRYPSVKGSFIEFTFKDRTLKMDFNNRGSYRFEFIQYSESGNNAGTKSFSKWPASGFITWIDEHLINSIIQ